MSCTQPRLTLKRKSDDAEEAFDLADGNVAIAIAGFLLDGTSPTEFLKGLETIEAIYTAEAIDQDGIPFTLAGDLVFQMAAPSDEDIATAKAAFMNKLKGRSS
ncbi:MAG: hypothetical protein ACOX1Y_10630 [Zhaonellaceae bacterium]